MTKRWITLLDKISRIRFTPPKVGASTIRTARLGIEEYIHRQLTLEKYSDPRHLVHYESKYFSQSGEDGVIAEVFNRIGTGTKRFIETGVGKDLENNTSYLLAQGWQGVWIDVIPQQQVTEGNGVNRYIERGDLVYLAGMVRADNVNEYLNKYLGEGEIDLLSLDLDRSTYQVWDAMDIVWPRVVVIEYNAFFPPPVRWIMPNGLNPLDSTTKCFGASLSCIADIGRKRGYRLVHCGLSGVNAFFVREDLINEKFGISGDEGFHYEPYRPFLLYDHELKNFI